MSSLLQLSSGQDAFRLEQCHPLGKAIPMATSYSNTVGGHYTEVYEIEETRRYVLLVKPVSVAIGMTTKDLDILHISNKQNSNSSSLCLQIAQNVVK